MTSPLAALAVFALATPPAPGDEAKSVDVVNRVEGRTTILRLIPEGERVKQGDPLCELDSSALRDRLTEQRINVANSSTVLLAARKEAEVAEVAAKESEAATVQEIKGIEGDIRTAELDIKIYKAKVEDAKFLMSLGEKAERPADYDHAVTMLARSENALTRSKAKLKTMKNFTQAKRKLQGEVGVRRAATELEAAEAIHAIEREREAKIRKQIAACVLRAPIDGRVQYANPRLPRADGYAIEEGALVRERQTLLRVIAID